MSSEIPENYQKIVNRFVKSIKDNPNLHAGFVFGSYATNASDIHSDLDLGLVVKTNYENVFQNEIQEFIEKLGTPLFTDDFGLETTIFFILDDGSECELTFVKKDDIQDLKVGPIEILIDKYDLLKDYSQQMPDNRIDKGLHLEVLEQTLNGFWHDFSHFITAIGRNHLWWAQGQLEELRKMCITLIYLDNDFSSEINDYDKIDIYLKSEYLDQLVRSVAQFKKESLVEGMQQVLSLFKLLGEKLAKEKEIEYPSKLEKIMIEKFSKIT